MESDKSKHQQVASVGNNGLTSTAAMSQGDNIDLPSTDSTTACEVDSSGPSSAGGELTPKADEKADKQPQIEQEPQDSRQSIDSTHNQTTTSAEISCSDGQEQSIPHETAKEPQIKQEPQDARQSSDSTHNQTTAAAEISCSDGQEQSIPHGMAKTAGWRRRLSGLISKSSLHQLRRILPNASSSASHTASSSTNSKK